MMEYAAYAADSQGMVWTMLHPQATPDHLGYVPGFLSASDPRSAQEQIATNYVGGWFPFEGFKLDPDSKWLIYPGDPPTRPIARTQLRDEEIYLYTSSWLAIIQPDGTFAVARLD